MKITVSGVEICIMHVIGIKAGGEQFKMADDRLVAI